MWSFSFNLKVESKPCQQGKVEVAIIDKRTSLSSGFQRFIEQA
jgi:hypothetical protein